MKDLEIQANSGSLSTTIMPETAREYVDILALLKGILNGYPGNSAIFREYRQIFKTATTQVSPFIS